MLGAFRLLHCRYIPQLEASSKRWVVWLQRCIVLACAWPYLQCEMSCCCSQLLRPVLALALYGQAGGAE